MQDCATSRCTALITPDNTPPWLPELLQIYGLEVTNDRKLLEGLLSNVEMRKRLGIRWRDS